MFEYKAIETGNMRPEQLEAALNECGSEGYRVVGVQPGRIILEREVPKRPTPGQRMKS